MEFSFFKKSDERSPEPPRSGRRLRQGIVWLLFILFWVLYYYGWR